MEEYIIPLNNCLFYVQLYLFLSLFNIPVRECVPEEYIAFHGFVLIYPWRLERDLEINN